MDRRFNQRCFRGVAGRGVKWGSFGARALRGAEGAVDACFSAVEILAPDEGTLTMGVGPVRARS